ncbi:Oidioi.mRNA.OKI2018_I69.chr1.g1096.t1.cds [Oikopleura dioica]|uniref:Oidioi.mRNA.OKI2018_I69.chr1.g1096.t1.cds n=1 Tax=Oikopleura dioica TaxID=34765 RepID=A0ABN7SW34_OIKDI|nr:Oidioi.mRNA.OKI2018_I69.chr1.g1096.t1.cds [Oikopleura dioica]
MKLFSAFLAGSALGQERLPAVQTACAAFRDEIKANNTIAGDGVWSCPKLNKNSKKTACKATCPGNKIAEFKKASFKVKCGNSENGPSGGVIKQKPADGTLGCHENLCNVNAENQNVAKGSLLLLGKKSKGGKVTERYALKCKNEKKKRKGTIICESDTGAFSSGSLPDYQTTCEASGKTYEKYTCDFNHADQASGVLNGKLFFERVEGKKKDKVVITGTVQSDDAEFDAGDHGIHVHDARYVVAGSPFDWTGGGAGQCKGANGHFSLDGQSHGFATNKLPNRHTGDLGSITATAVRRSGRTATVDIEDTVVSLDPASNLFIGDRTLVIHADGDDGTGTVGNAGSRPGCCAIKPIRYSCTFDGNAGADGDVAITGTIDIRYADGKVAFSGSLAGVPEGKHGFHVHQEGDVTNSCGNVGSHFQVDAENEIHGTPDKPLGQRHAGDIGNLVAAADETATANFMDAIVSLSTQTQPSSAVDRSSSTLNE